MNENMHTIEINGVKLEVDLRTAKRIDTFAIGTKVKLLRKKTPYQDMKVFPGVIVGFEPFDSLPTIIVAYMDVDYSNAKLEFAHINAASGEKWDLIASIDDDLPVQKQDVLSRMDREIEVKRNEIAEIERKRDYFLSHFNRYFERESAPAA